MADHHEVQKVSLYSYNKAWNVEKKIYSIYNVILPAPVNPYMVLIFIVLLCFFMLLERLIPALANTPVIIRYLVFPYLGTGYLMKKKLDGKNPVKYLFGVLFHTFSERSRYIERFTSYPDRKEMLPLHWICSRGKQLTLPSKPQKSKRTKSRKQNIKRKRKERKNEMPDQLFC